jgi:hypothetical protein
MPYNRINSRYKLGIPANFTVLNVESDTTYGRADRVYLKLLSSSNQRAEFKANLSAAEVPVLNTTLANMSGKTFNGGPKRFLHLPRG